MYPVNDWWTFDWSCTNHGQVERVVKTYTIMRKESNWYREQEPPPLRSEVARAIHHQTACLLRATHPNEVPTATFKPGRETVLHEYTEYGDNLGNWRVSRRTDFLHVIPLNQINIKQCVNYSVIALVSHTSTSLLRPYWKGSTHSKQKRALLTNRREF